MIKLIINKTFVLIFVVCVLPCYNLYAQQETRAKALNDRQVLKMAQQYENNGQYKEAADIYYRQSINNPLDISSYAGAKRCLLKNNEINRLYNLIVELQKSRRDIRYEIDLAEIEYLQGDKKKAAAHWNQILEENSVQIDAYILTGQIYLDNRLFDEAIECYLLARRKLKDQNLFIFELAGLYTAQSRYELMTLEYLHYLEINPNQVDFIDGRLTDCEKDAGSSDKIANTLEKQLKANKKLALPIHQLLGNLYIRAEKYDLAFSHILALEQELSAVESKTTGSYLYRFARITSHNGRPDFARNAYNAIITSFPKSVFVDKARIGLALILEQEGQFLQAVEIYEKFISSYPKSPESATALLQVGDLWFKQLFDIGKAEQAYQRIVQSYPWGPEVVEAILKLADCAIISNNYTGAEKQYNSIISRYSKKPDVNLVKAQLSMARLEFYRGFPAKSNYYLDACFKQNINKPGNPDIYENDALELQMLLQEFKNDSTGLALYGNIEVLILQRNYVKAESLLVDFRINNPEKPINKELAYLLAGVKRQQGEYQAAINELTNLYNDEKYLYRDKALKNIAEIYEQDMQITRKAIENYESLLAIFPESIYIEQVRKNIRILEKKREKNN